MNEKYSKARQTAEKAFTRTQVETPASEPIRTEADLVAQARQEKTARLRQARLAHEATETAPPAVPKGR